jgi:hypothetical protein
MNKIRALVLAFAMVCSFAVPAFAKVKDFGYFTADVPDTWTIEQSEGDVNEVSFTAPDNTAVVAVSISNSEGGSTEEIIANMAGVLGAKPEESDGTYVFSFKNRSGIDSYAIVRVEEDANMIITFTFSGNHPDMEGIVDSMTIKDDADFSAYGFGGAGSR